MDQRGDRSLRGICRRGYPLDAEALLIVEVEGSRSEIGILLGRIAEIAARFDPKTVQISAAPTRARGFGRAARRRSARSGASPITFCMDGTIPLAQLPHALTRISQICAEHGLKVANIFHAGDGNLHPLILYDANTPERRRAELAGETILKLCVELRRLPHRRAWRRHRKARADDDAVLADGSDRPDADKNRFRSDMAAESGEGVSARITDVMRAGDAASTPGGCLADGAIVSRTFSPRRRVGIAVR